jgi:hypothetical protein
MKFKMIVDPEEIEDPPPTDAAVTLMEMKSRHCKYPLWPDFGKVKTRYYCGERRAPNSAYCPEHMILTMRS